MGRDVLLEDALLLAATDGAGDQRDEHVIGLRQVLAHVFVARLALCAHAQQKVGRAAANRLVVPLHHAHEGFEGILVLLVDFAESSNDHPQQRLRAAM
jgi:hypothetical protein